VKGNVTINDTIELPSYTVLQIHGKITLADDSDCTILETAASATDIAVIGGEIYGVRANQTGGIGLHFASGTKKALVFGTKFYQIKEHAVFVNANCEDITALGIHALECEMGFATWYGGNKRITLANSHIVNSYRDGVYIRSGNHVNILGNTILNSSQETADQWTGILTYGDATSQVLHVNIIGNISCDDQDTPTQRYGVSLDGDAQANSDYYTVVGNTLRGNAVDQYNQATFVKESANNVLGPNNEPYYTQSPIRIFPSPSGDAFRIVAPSSFTGRMIYLDKGGTEVFRVGPSGYIQMRDFLQIAKSDGTERTRLTTGTAGNRGVIKVWDVTKNAFAYYYSDNGVWTYAATEPT